MESNFRTTVVAVLQHLYANPQRLEEKQPEMRKRLDLFCGKGQGLGNKSSDHEACFAVVVGEFMFLPYQSGIDGYFYQYQAHGTQRSIDFRLLEVTDGKMVDFVDLDLKHGEKEGIFLNDGKFLDNVVYVVSFSRSVKVEGQKKKQREYVCLIARGQDIMTDKDRARLEERQVLLRKLNDLNENGDFLVLYARSANRYECKQFTPEFVENAMMTVGQWLLPSSPQTEQEPHSQSA
jgi:hypothetical protein